MFKVISRIHWASATFTGQRVVAECLGDIGDRDIAAIRVFDGMVVADAVILPRRLQMLLVDPTYALEAFNA